jgi:hypothetical protein
MGRTGGKAKPDAQTATAVVEIKRGLSAVRSFRDVLVQLLALLVAHPNKTGYLLLTDPRVSDLCLQQEMNGLKAAMRSDIACRLHLIVGKEGAIANMPDGLPEADRALLEQCVNARASTSSQIALPRPDPKGEVFLVILHRWFLGQGPMTSRWLQDTVGCNYRTVSAAIGRLGPEIARHSDRRIELQRFPEEAWRRFQATAHQTRATMLYADTSNQPRSPESLVQRLGRLGREDVAVGGVIGARRHWPDLDIVGTPRLDLCVHAPGKHVDLDFVQQLDPALERTRDTHRPARLALHFIRRKTRFLERGVVL